MVYEGLPMFQSLEFVLRHYDVRGRLREWLTVAWDRGFNHGAELVESYGTARGPKDPAMPDGVAAADKVLTVLEREGWLERGKLCPTPSQRFFDVNRQMRSGHMPSGFGWMPVRTCAAYAEHVGRQAEPES